MGNTLRASWPALYLNRIVSLMRWRVRKTEVAVAGRLLIASMAVLSLAALPLSGQQSLTSEYIRLGGRVIAIEHPIFVTVPPPTNSTVYPGQTRQLTATVNGSTNQTVTWAVTSGAGTINAQGLYTAPATITSASSVTIQATAAADTTKTGTVTLNLSPNPALTIAPTEAVTLFGGQTQQFTATVNIGTVDWSCSPAVGQISTAGLYTAPNPVDSTQTITIRATSHSNPSVSVTAPAQLVPVAISIADTSGSTVAAGSTLQLTATVTGTTNIAATWSIVSGLGSIDANTGVYTAPNSVDTPQSVTVRATAAADTRRTAEKTITVALRAAQACSLSGSAEAAIAAGETRVVTVTCTAPAAWGVSLPPGVTWITASPSSGAGSGSVALTVAPNDPPPVDARSAVVTIAEHTYTLSQHRSGTLALNPAGASLSHGQTTQFTALLDGSTPVTGLAEWRMSDGSVGTVVGGLYTAPPTIQPSQTTATVKATYDAYSTMLATATIILQEYAPPFAMAISPDSGSQLTQTFQLTLSDVHGASQINFVHLNFATSSTDLAGGCYVSVEPNFSPNGPGHRLRVMQSTAWGDAVRLGDSDPSHWAENSRCRVFSQVSSATESGTDLTINLNIAFKPGFIGTFGAYIKAYNQQTAYSDWTPAGTWNLTANVADQPPHLTVEQPAAGATVLGSVTISGVAYDNQNQYENKVTGLQVLIDGQAIASPIRVARTDICTTSFDRMDCPNAGYSVTWNTTAVSNGTHTIRVQATDSDAPKSPVRDATGVDRIVTVNNPPAPVLSISPALVDVRQLYNPPATAIEQQQFTAALSGNPPPTDVSWSISAPSPNNPGTISSAGLYTTASYWYASPGTQVTVAGTRSSNPSQTASAIVNLVGVMTCGGTATPMVMSPGYWYCGAAVPLINMTITPSAGYFSGPYYYPPPTNSTLRTVIIEGRSSYNTNIKYKLQVTLYPY